MNYIAFVVGLLIVPTIFSLWQTPAAVGQAFPGFVPDSSSLPQWVITSVTDGCAEWSGDSITSTGSDCGSGGGSSLFTLSNNVIDSDGASTTATTSIRTNYVTATSTDTASTFAGGIVSTASSTFTDTIHADGTLHFQDLFNFDAQLKSGLNRLILKSDAGNADAELFLAPTGSNVGAATTWADSPNTNNFGGLRVGTDGTKNFIRSTSSGSGTTLPLEIQSNGNVAMTFNTDDSIDFDQLTTNGLLQVSGGDGSLSASTSISSSFIDDDYLFNTGDTITGNLTFSGASIVIGGDTINEFAGTGLTVTGNALTADLGTAITSSEITDDEIVNADINSSAAIAYSKLNLTGSVVEGDFGIGAPTNGYILVASSSATGAMEWTSTTSANLGLVQSSDLHDAVTLSGTPDYITLSGQDIIRSKLDLTDDLNTFTEANLYTMLTDVSQFYESGDEDTIAGSISEGSLANDIILEEDLKAVDAANDEDVLTFESTTGDFEWHTILELINAVTGAVDWGGITSFEIPNGANPTIDDAGEIALDTTASQWVGYNGSSVDVFLTEIDRSLGSIGSTSQDRALNSFDSGTTTWSGGHVTATTTVTAVMGKTDTGTCNVRVGNGSTWSTSVSADSDGQRLTISETFNPSSTGGSTLGDEIQVEIGGCASSSNYVTPTITQHEVRQ